MITIKPSYSGEKQYTYRECVSTTNRSTELNCNQCKEESGVKVSFKVSKQIKSVMVLQKFNEGSHSYVQDNCKIFDENNFECTDELEPISSSSVVVYGMKTTLTVSNGIWERKMENYGFVFDGKIEKEYFRHNCGYEIKSLFNFFN